MTSPDHPNNKEQSQLTERELLLEDLNKARAEDLNPLLVLFCKKSLPVDGTVEAYLGKINEALTVFKERYQNVDLLSAISPLIKLKEICSEIDDPSLFYRALSAIHFPGDHPNNRWVGSDGDNLHRFDCEMENDLSRIRAEALITNAFDVDLFSLVKKNVQEVLIRLFAMYKLPVPAHYREGVSEEKISELIEDVKREPVVAKTVLDSVRTRVEKECPECFGDDHPDSGVRDLVDHIDELNEKEKVQLLQLSEDEEFDLDTLTEMVLDDIDSIPYYQ